VIYDVVTALFATTLVAYSLIALIAVLDYTRPALSIGRAVSVGVALRLLATFVIATTAPDLFGPDEQQWLTEARALSQQPLLAHTPLDPQYPLHIWIFSLELRFFEFPELTMRIVQIGISVSGLILLAAAVHDIAGARAATVASWVLLLEPAGAFFGGLLHKEALMVFSTGLVVFGGVKFWTRQNVQGLGLLLFGCAIGVATRPYAGWALTAASAALVVHRGLTRQGDWRRRSLLVAIIVAALALLSVPTVLESSEENLETLQNLQDATTSSGANLALEPVTYSSPVDLVLNLPRRSFDLLVRPFPWQLANTSQRLGFFGTVTALATLAFLITALPANAGSIMSRAAPFVYPALLLFAAYAISIGDAGTSFRHRAQLVALGMCLVCALRGQGIENDGVSQK
jgi:hypothetical protein